MVVIGLAKDVVSGTEICRHARTQLLDHARNVVTEHNGKAVLNVETPVSDPVVVWVY